MAAFQPESFIIGILAFKSISLNPLESINVQLHVNYHLQEGRDSASCFAASNLLLLMNAAIFILSMMISQGSICDSRHEVSHLLLFVFCSPEVLGEATTYEEKDKISSSDKKRERGVLTVIHQCSSHNSHGMSSICISCETAFTS